MTAIKRLIPNLFTAGNLVGGILAILFALTGHIVLAPYCIFISALLDFLDGFMARLLKVPSELGKQLDSLADMVTFGVAPGIIVFVMLGTQLPVFPELSTFGESISSYYIKDITIDGEIIVEQNGISPTIINYGWHKFLPYFAFIIPVFALFRLAKFNIDTRQSDSFIGLPTPAMTLYIAVLPLLYSSTMNQIALGELSTASWEYSAVTIISNPLFLMLSSLVLSILMVAEIPLFALKFKHFKIKGNEIRYLFLTIAIALLAILFFWSLPLIIILYVLLSIINNQFVKARTNEI